MNIIASRIASLRKVAHRKETTGHVSLIEQAAKKEADEKQAREDRELMEAMESRQGLSIPPVPWITFESVGANFVISGEAKMSATPITFTGDNLKKSKLSKVDESDLPPTYILLEELDVTGQHAMPMGPKCPKGSQNLLKWTVIGENLPTCPVFQAENARIQKKTAQTSLVRRYGIPGGLISIKIKFHDPDDAHSRRLQRSRAGRDSSSMVDSYGRPYTGVTQTTASNDDTGWFVFGILVQLDGVMYPRPTMRKEARLAATRERVRVAVHRLYLHSKAKLFSLRIVLKECKGQELPVSYESLNSNGVFVLDAWEIVYVWIGNQAVVSKRKAAMPWVETLKAQDKMALHAKGLVLKVEVIEDGKEPPAFWALLGGQGKVTIKGAIGELALSAEIPSPRKPEPPLEVGRASVAVIGGGIAGVACARALHDLHFTVTLFEKKTALGGRLSKYLPNPIDDDRLGAEMFTSGCPFFCARSQVFRQHVEKWLTQGIVRRWRPFMGVIGSDGKFSPFANHASVPVVPKCAVCIDDLYSAPETVPCCGQNICQNCATRAWGRAAIREKTRVCPVCNETFQAMSDKEIRAHLLQQTLTKRAARSKGGSSVASQILASRSSATSDRSGAQKTALSDLPSVAEDGFTIGGVSSAGTTRTKKVPPPPSSGGKTKEDVENDAIGVSAWNPIGEHYRESHTQVSAKHGHGANLDWFIATSMSGMAGICERLMEGIGHRTGHAVKAIERVPGGGKYRIGTIPTTVNPKDLPRGHDGRPKLTYSKQTFDWVVCALPAQQAAVLYKEHCPQMAQYAHKIKQDGIWVLNVTFNYRLNIVFDVAFVEEKPELCFMARERTRARAEYDEAAMTGGEKSEVNADRRDSWILHATSSWSEARRKTSAKRVAHEMIAAFLDAVKLQYYQAPIAPLDPGETLHGNNEPIEGQMLSATFWEHGHLAKVQNAYDVLQLGPEKMDARTRALFGEWGLNNRSLLDVGLQVGMVGDWCVDSSVEGAFMSGAHVAGRIVESMGPALERRLLNRLGDSDQHRAAAAADDKLRRDRWERMQERQRREGFFGETVEVWRSLAEQTADYPPIVRKLAMFWLNRTILRKCFNAWKGDLFQNVLLPYFKAWVSRTEFRPKPIKEGQPGREPPPYKTAVEVGQTPAIAPYKLTRHYHLPPLGADGADGSAGGAPESGSAATAEGVGGVGSVHGPSSQVPKSFAYGTTGKPAPYKLKPPHK